MKRLLQLLSQNANGLIFLVGCELVREGLGLWSPAAARVFAGCVGMAIGAWPYLVRTFGARKR